MLYIIFIFSLIYAALAWRRLDWAIMAMIIGLPLYQIRFSFTNIPFTVLELMILIAFTVWAIKNHQKIFKNFKLSARGGPALGWKIKIRYPFDTEIFLLLIISWIAIAIAGFSDSALGIWKAYFFEPILVYILIVNVFNKHSVNKLIWSLTILSFGVSLSAILQRIGFLASPENFWPRVTGPFTYPNALGLLLSPLVLIMTAWFMQTISINKNLKFKILNFKFLFITTVILMSVSAIALAQNEGAAFGVIVAMIIVGFLLRVQKKPNLKWLPISLIVFVLGGALFSSIFFLQIVPEYKYFNFDKKIFNYITDKAMLKDISGEIRKQQWRETWQVLTASPKNFIFGLGLSNYQKTIKPIHQEGIFFNFERDKKFRTKIVWFNEEYKAKHWQPVEIYMYPHNFFLNFWVELGLLGALLFVWIIIKPLAVSFKLLDKSRENRHLILGVIGAVIVIVVHGIVDVPYFKNDISVLFWVIVGILGIFQLENKSKNVLRFNNEK
ncbi:MAG: O-antigen ligase family protein [Patescibacteria group bacterium]|nr:O-antigen ligase family protein [Patescibacteria group bacterium]